MRDWIAYGREEAHREAYKEAFEESAFQALRNVIQNLRRAGISAEVVWECVSSAATAYFSEENAKQLHDLAFQQCK